MSTGWIDVDLDGTLAQYNGSKGVEHIGEPTDVEGFLHGLVRLDDTPTKIQLQLPIDRNFTGAMWYLLRLRCR